VRADLAKGGARPLPSYLASLGGELSAAIAREYARIVDQEVSHATGWGPKPAADTADEEPPGPPAKSPHPRRRSPAPGNADSPLPPASPPRSVESALDALSPLTGPIV